MVKHFKLLIANFVSLKSKIRYLPYSRIHQGFTTEYKVIFCNLLADSSKSRST